MISVARFVPLGWSADFKSWNADEPLRIGLWLFSRSGQLLDFGLVAMVVQAYVCWLCRFFCAFFRLASRSFDGSLSCHWCSFTAALAVVLLGSSDGKNLPLIGVLAIQGVAAIAEAMLVVRLSGLIPLLISNRERLQRANGLFAQWMDWSSPWRLLGSWFIASQGLEGVLLLDGISFWWPC